MNIIRRIRNRFNDIPAFITRFRAGYGLRLLVKRYFHLPTLVGTKSGAVYFLGIDAIDDIIMKHLNTTLRETYFPGDLVLSSGDVVLDVGGHHGLFAIELACMFPGIKVYTFEPSQKSFRYLRMNLSLNRGLDITPIRAALSANSGTARLVKSDEGSWGNYLTTTDTGDDEVVPTLSIVDFLKARSIDKVAFIKMNAEGAEFAVIPDLLTNQVVPAKMLLFGHPEKGNLKDLLDFVRKEGYVAIPRNDDDKRPCHWLTLS